VDGGSIGPARPVVPGRSPSRQLGDLHAGPVPNFLNRGMGALMDSGGPNEDRTTLPGLNKDGMKFGRTREKAQT
jgi:hypothetical protein